MSGDFKSLRRKLGIVSLVVACVFAAGWVRSEIVKDLFIVQFAGSHPYNFSSNRSQMSCHWDIISNTQLTSRVFWYTQPLQPSIPSKRARELKGDATWRLCGFLLLRDGLRFDCVVPYGMVVIPLTLLSAWLLLSKGRQMQAALPTAESS